MTRSACIGILSLWHLQDNLCFTEFSLVLVVVVVQLLGCVWFFVTPWTAAHQSSHPFTISQSLLKLMYIESVMPSNHLILCCPLLLSPAIFPSIRVFSNELALHIRWPKHWSFSFSISSSNEYLGLIFFRIDWFDLGISRVFVHAVVQRRQFFNAQPFFIVQLSHL